MLKYFYKGIIYILKKYFVFWVVWKCNWEKCVFQIESRKYKIKLKQLREYTLKYQIKIIIKILIIKLF